MINFFGLIQFERGLIAKCVMGNSREEIVKNGTRLSTSSKVFYEVIKGLPFFNALVYEIESNHPYFLSKHEDKGGSLKNRFFRTQKLFFM